MLELWFTSPSGISEGVLFNNRSSVFDRDGITVLVDYLNRLNIFCNGISYISREDIFSNEQKHQICINLEPLSKVLSVVVDGKLLNSFNNDEEFRGWLRLEDLEFSIFPEKKSVNATVSNSIELIRIYDQYLLTAEMIHNYEFEIKK